MIEGADGGTHAGASSAGPGPSVPSSADGSEPGARSDRGGPGALALPPTGDALRLVVALLAVSTSGPLIAATAAPALAIAFWRNAMASGLLVPWALGRVRRELSRLTRREWRLAIFGGLLLAGHFGTWVPSVTYTSVAAATALVATQPVWAALILAMRGGRLPRTAWVGIAVAVAGAAALTGADVNLSGRAVTGDLLAVVGAMFAAAYATVGGEVRQSVSTTSYTTICYSVTAVGLLAACLVGRQHLAGYSGEVWVQLAALTLGAQLLGHSLFNRVLRSTSPLVLSLAILFEVPGAALIAAIFLHQGIRAVQLPGAALLGVGIVTVIRGGGRGIPVE